MVGNAALASEKRARAAKQQKTQDVEVLHETHGAVVDANVVAGSVPQHGEDRTHLVCWLGKRERRVSSFVPKGALL